MCADNESNSRPLKTRPKKYYWPWECTYYWPWQWRIRWQGGNPLKGFRFSLAALMLIVTAAAFGSCCVGLVVRSAEGENLTAAEANRRLKYVHFFCEVPDGATNVSLRASYPGAIISFDMPFPDFARYCVDRGWYLRQIDPNWPQRAYDVDYKPFIITNGYYYQKFSDSGRGYAVFYDMSTRRAWIRFSNR